MNKRVPLLLLCGLLSLGSMAQEQPIKKAKKVRLPHIEYRHDFRAGIGTPAPRQTCGVRGDIAPPLDLDNQPIRENEVTPNLSGTPNFYVYYGYRIIKGLKVTATVSYYNDYYPRVDTYTSGHDGDFWAGGTGRNHHIRIAPAVQYEWYNRGIVTMYSELGVTFDITKKTEDEFQGVTYNNGTKLYIRPNLTPFGITVGKKVFGFAEVLSLGPRGIVSAGIGYRF